MPNEQDYLSKREQQIMELAYAKGQLVAADLETELPGNPSNSAVRTFLRILEKKGHLAHKEENGRYVYTPTKPAKTAGKTALSNLVQTFFGGSVSGMFATLLTDKEARISETDLARLKQMIEEAQKQ